jgi:hypothetical protein
MNDIQSVIYGVLIGLGILCFLVLISSDNNCYSRENFESPTDAELAFGALKLKLETDLIETQKQLSDQQSIINNIQLYQQYAQQLLQRRGNGYTPDDEQIIHMLNKEVVSGRYKKSKASPHQVLQQVLQAQRAQQVAQQAQQAQYAQQAKPTQQAYQPYTR